MFIDTSEIEHSAKSSAEEQHLIRRILGGEPECFVELVGNDRQRLRSTAARLTGDMTAAEDVVQNALCKAFGHLRQFQGKASFHTWLFRILVNEAYMWTRRKGKETNFGRCEEDWLSEAAARHVSRRSTLDKLVATETSCRLNVALTRLPAKYQHVLRLRFLEGHSIHETARQLALTKAAAKSRQHRACEMLKAQLAVNDVRELRLSQQRGTVQ